MKGWFNKQLQLGSCYYYVNNAVWDVHTGTSCVLISFNLIHSETVHHLPTETQNRIFHTTLLKMTSF